LDIEIAAMSSIVDGEHSAGERGDADDSDHRLGFELECVAPMNDPLLDPNVSVLQPEFFASDPIRENANARPQRGEAQAVDAHFDNLDSQHVAWLSAADADGPGRRVNKGQPYVGMGELLVERMDEMAANIEFGFHLENLVGTDLGNEGIGRRQRIFQIAFLDNLTAKLACLCLSMHPSSPLGDPLGRQIISVVARE
jgi:hypothetical protein